LYIFALIAKFYAGLLNYIKFIMLCQDIKKLDGLCISRLLTFVKLCDIMLILHRIAGWTGSSPKGGDAVVKNLLRKLAWIAIALLFMYFSTIKVN